VLVFQDNFQLKITSQPVHFFLFIFIFISFSEFFKKILEMHTLVITRQFFITQNVGIFFKKEKSYNTMIETKVTKKCQSCSYRFLYFLMLNMLAQID